MLNVELRSFCLILVLSCILIGCKVKTAFSSEWQEINRSSDVIKKSLKTNKKKDLTVTFSGRIDECLIFREDFFQEIRKKNIENANLIEIVDMFHDDYYSAYLQMNNDVFIYETYFQKDIIRVKKVSLEEFIKNKVNYGSLSCILIKMMNNDVDDLLDDVLTTNFHHSVFISKVVNVKHIETQTLLDICM